ncbi:MAG: CinA family protein [Candidatus Spyradocola sp.]|jgi:nicotinamide-nucleotide amidase
MTALEGYAREVVAQLLEKKLTISLAESCTGGMITSALVAWPGVSAALLEGCVCYSNAAKMRRLGVLTETLQKHGAVSAECALEMVHGICHTTGSDCGIAVTGIAGPDGGTAEKPVGLVYMAVQVKGCAVVREKVFRGTRAQVRREAAKYVLRELLNELERIGDKED